MFAFIGKQFTIKLFRKRLSPQRVMINDVDDDCSGYWPYRYSRQSAPRIQPAPDQIRLPKEAGSCVVPEPILNYAVVDKDVPPDEDPSPVPPLPRRFQSIDHLDVLTGRGILEKAYNPYLETQRVPISCISAGSLTTGPLPKAANHEIHDYFPPCVDPYDYSVYERFAAYADPETMLVPVYTTYKKMDDQTYKPLQIWDGRRANRLNTFAGRPFSLYNFHSIYYQLLSFKLLQKKLLLAKFDWQNFYNSIILPDVLCGTTPFNRCGAQNAGYI